MDGGGDKTWSDNGDLGNISNVPEFEFACQNVTKGAGKQKSGDMIWTIEPVKGLRARQRPLDAPLSRTAAIMSDLSGRHEMSLKQDFSLDLKIFQGQRRAS